MRARDLVGRRIVAVRQNRWWCPSYQKWCTDPVLVLDNGTTLHFVVQETGSGEYGISITVTKPKAKS